MPADALREFATRLEVMATAIGPDGLKAALTEVGMKAKADAAEAVQREGSKKGSLADQSMSHWRRGNPFEIAARFQVEGATVTVAPTPRTRGPWRVLEEGRAYGSSTDLVLVGRARKDGTRRGRSRGRNQGSTPGKRTWSDAEALIEKRFPERAEPALLAQVKKAWG